MASDTKICRCMSGGICTYTHPVPARAFQAERITELEQRIAEALQVLQGTGMFVTRNARIRDAIAALKEPPSQGEE